LLQVQPILLGQRKKPLRCSFGEVFDENQAILCGRFQPLREQHGIAIGDGQFDDSTDATPTFNYPTYTTAKVDKRVKIFRPITRKIRQSKIVA